MTKIIIGLLWGGLALLLFLSRKEPVGLSEKIGSWLYGNISRSDFLRKRGFVPGTRVRRTLHQLYPTENPEELLETYYTGKLQYVLLVIFAGSILALGVEISGREGNSEFAEGIITRGKVAREITLEAKASENPSWKETILLEVPARLLREEEAEALFQEFLPLLEEQILGDNEAFDQIRCDMDLVNQIEEYPFWVEWKSSRTDLIDQEGNLKEQALQELDEPQTLVLTGEISYEGYLWEESWELVVNPPERSPREQFFYDLTRESQKSAEENRFEESFVLPRTVEGQGVSWKYVSSKEGLLLLVFFAAAAVGIFFLQDRDLEKELQKRRGQLKQAYPGMVGKYALYLGAGTTVRGAFQRICQDLGEKAVKERQGCSDPLYEEMIYACNELKAGISESRVYEHFGRRTGVQEYTRLGTLLGQNLKKGSGMLALRLQEESEEALRENAQLLKRRGEEAQTKLLLPMVMLLLMILLLIMLPAFSGLGI